MYTENCIFKFPLRESFAFVSTGFKIYCLVESWWAAQPQATDRSLSVSAMGRESKGKGKLLHEQ